MAKVADGKGRRNAQNRRASCHFFGRHYKCRVVSQICQTRNPWACKRIEARLCLITDVANAGVCVSIFLVALDQKDSVWSVQGNGIRNIFQCGITTTAVNIAEESELQVTEKAVRQL